MRKSETHSLADILKSYVEENNLERKFSEMDLIGSWESVVGKSLAKYTRNLSIHNNILFIETSSSIVRNELLLRKEDIRIQLNKVAGKEVIQKIVFK